MGTSIQSKMETQPLAPHPHGVDDKRIAVAVNDHLAKDIAIDAIRGVGFTPIPLDEPNDLLSISRFCSGSVCDFHMNGEALRTIQALRSVDPAHPVLLIVYPKQETTPDPSTSIDMGVRYCTGEDEDGLRTCLAANLEWLMQYHPVDALLNTMMEGVPDPSTTTVRFLEWSIRAVHAGSSPRIERGAKDLGVSTRTLARHLRDDRMPAPIELYGWSKLLAVSHRSDLNCTSLAAAARTFNIDASRLYQLRRRLMRKTRYGGRKSDRPVFPFVLQAFHERCLDLRPPN